MFLDLTEKDIPDEVLQSEIMYVNGKDKKGASTCKYVYILGTDAFDKPKGIPVADTGCL